MIRLILVFILFAGTMQAQTDQQDKEQNSSVEEKMEEAMSKFSEMLDSLGGQNSINMKLDTTMFKAFGFGNENMEDLNGFLDSLDLYELFGGNNSKSFEEGFPSLEGMDMKQLDQLMEQSLEMLNNIDPNQMQKMMEAIDMSELMNLFDNMDIEGFMSPPMEKKNAPKEDKKLKKI